MLKKIDVQIQNGLKIDYYSLQFYYLVSKVNQFCNIDREIMFPYNVYQVPPFNCLFQPFLDPSYFYNRINPLYYQKNYQQIHDEQQIVKEQFKEATQIKATQKQIMKNCRKCDYKKVLWSEQQDNLLKYYVRETQLNWRQISDKINGRNPKMCYNRYQRLLANKKNLWTNAQDNKLKRLVQVEKLKWKKIEKHFQNRNPKQLRQRYLNFLRPHISKQPWTLEEDTSILMNIQKFGKKWKKNINFDENKNLKSNKKQILWSYKTQDLRTNDKTQENEKIKFVKNQNYRLNRLIFKNLFSSNLTLKSKTKIQQQTQFQYYWSLSAVFRKLKIIAYYQTYFLNFMTLSNKQYNSNNSISSIFKIFIISQIMFRLLTTVPRRFFSSNQDLLKPLGIVGPQILRNLPIASFYEHGMKYAPSDRNTKMNAISSTGAFVAYSGAKTGRSPAAKRIVTDQLRQKQIAWGNINIRMRESSFPILEHTAVDYMNTRSRIYVVDGYAGYDVHDRIKIRVVCTRSYHAMFMTNMLIRPTKEELEKDFKYGADYYILNAGEVASDKNVPDVGLDTCVALNFGKQKMVILGSQYAGQMKKGVFTIMNYLMPKRGHLPLHSSCNVGKDNDVCLFFGLSGTGKTALSAVGDRKLIGDDEHVWTDKGVFNIEGGCYAKCVGLSAAKQPQIYSAIRFGTVLQNVVLNPSSKEVDYNDTTITENTRASYPLQLIQNAQIPAVTTHPKNIVFLTCDAFSVLPPVSRLTPQQALYHFYSGYTSKIAGTEQGIKQPTPTFSACFGQAFMPLPIQVYADLLLNKIQKHNVKVWLVNTGWTGGRYGVGSRISIKNTKNIVNAIHEGRITQSNMAKLPIFDLAYPKEIQGVDTHILNPADSWADKKQFNDYLTKVAKMFVQNFKKYENIASNTVKAGAPKL